MEHLTPKTVRLASSRDCFRGRGCPSISCVCFINPSLGTFQLRQISLDVLVKRGLLVSPSSMHEFVFRIFQRPQQHKLISNLACDTTVVQMPPVHVATTLEDRPSHPPARSLLQDSIGGTLALARGVQTSSHVSSTRQSVDFVSVHVPQCPSSVETP